MGGEVRCLLAVTIVAIIGGFRAENSDVNDGTGMEFPSCNDSVSCTTFCTTINILEEFSSTIPRARQDISNVICLDTGQQQQPSASEIILLHGCPSQGYFATNQSTVGVCYEDTQDMRDLLLTPSTMVNGLHSFICLLGSNQSLYTYAIAISDQGDDTVLFTDVRVYRYVNDSNPMILAMANETMNVAVREDDELTIVARVVTRTANSIIKAIASSPLAGENATNRFTTATGFLCNNGIDDFSGLGRYQLYALKATMNDDQTTIRIFINFTDTNETVTNETVTIGQINITVLEKISPPDSTTGTLVPTESPPIGEEDDNGSATTIIISVVIPLLLLIILGIGIVIAILIVLKRHKSHAIKSKYTTESTDFKPSAPVGHGQNTSRLKVLIYASVDHPIDLLLSKLLQNDMFMIEELAEIPSFLYNEYISKISMELNVGTVLLDCGCPGQAHDDLHKAVKYFTLKPFGSDESNSWHILRLIHTDGEIDSQSWSPLFDHVEEMCYGELNDEVVNTVVHKLLEYAPTSRASSIGSRKADERLLESQRQHQERKRDKEFAKIIVTELKAGTDRVIEHMDKNKQETHDKLDGIDDDIGVVHTQVSSMMEDKIRGEKEEREPYRAT